MFNLDNIGYHPAQWARELETKLCSLKFGGRGAGEKLLAKFFIGSVQALRRCCPITLEHSVVINYILWLSIIRYSLFKQRHPTHSTFQSSFSLFFFFFKLLRSFLAVGSWAPRTNCSIQIFYLCDDVKNDVRESERAKAKADGEKQTETLREI